MATVGNEAFRRVLAVNAKGIQRTGERIFHSALRPWCDNPVPRSLFARGSKDVIFETGTPYHLDIWVPCRKCEKCLAYRRMDWMARIKSEMAAAEKNWFVTLTFRPTAREELFMEKDDNDQLRLLDAASRNSRALAEVSMFIKRLRAGLASSDAKEARLRFFAVTEQHRDGFPHIHLVLHCGKDYRQAAILGGKWKWGFASAKLVDGEAARYLTKYLTKEYTRVRASLNYGLGSPSRRTSPATQAQSGLHANVEDDRQRNEGDDHLTHFSPPREVRDSARAEASRNVTPEALLDVQLYNGELSVDDHAAVYATLVAIRNERYGRPSQRSSRSCERGEGLVSRSTRSARLSRRSGSCSEKAAAGDAQDSVEKPVASRPEKGREDRKVDTGKYRKAPVPGSSK